MARAMKDSGIEWIGEIPEDWDVIRIKNIFSYRNERNSLPLDEVNLISLYTDKGVVQHCDLEETTGNKASNADGYKLVFEGDIVVNIILCWMGAIGRSAYTGVTSPAYDVYEPKENADSRFYHYLFRTSGFSGDCYKYGRGIMAMRWRTYSDEFRSIKVVYPPLTEQREIVAYLDSKCAEIDAVIERTRATIEEYKALKQSVITEAVTKGVRGSRPMKDSGIEWIGRIPKEWDMASIKRLFSIFSGATPKSDIAEYWDGEIVWITPADYKTEDKYITSGKRNLSQTGYNSCGTTLVPANSIVFSKRAPIGTVALSTKPLCTNQGCLSCVAKTGTVAELYYYVFSAFAEQFNLYGTGTTFKEISFTSFANFIVPYMAPQEQNEICLYLRAKCAEVDRLITAKQQLLTELESYKKSLIYEYVTGKKEVAECQQ